MTPSPDRLRVAVIAGTLAVGGAEKQLVLHVKALRQMGADVHVYSLTRGDYHESAITAMQVPVSWFGRTTQPATRVIALTAALRRFKPHVVQSTHTFTNLYAAFAARAIGAVSIGALRSSLQHTASANGVWTRPLLKLPTALVVNSESARALIARLDLVRPERLFVLRNAIECPAEDAAAARSGRAEFSVAHVVALAAGRLVRVKRFDWFIEAVAEARKTVPVHGVIVGEGPERSALQSLVDRLGLKPFIVFRGAVDDTGPEFRAAHLLVCSSEDEGVPNVVLEAMAHGLPVVTTAAGDLPLVVQDGVTGFVVQPGDVASLADRIVRLAQSPEQRGVLGDGGRAAIRSTFAADRLGPALLSMYRAVGRLGSDRELLRVLHGSGARGDLVQQA
jgi:glycosyltransferase involved in cell wall biosynthesis